MNKDYNFYNNDEIPEEERRDTAFQTVTAIRESFTLAKRQQIPITYEKAFTIIKDLDEKLYDSILDLLTNKNENDLVKYYKDEANAISTDENKVHPLELINKELERVEQIIKNAENKNHPQLIRRKITLIGAKEYFTPRSQSEHKSLNHDFYLRSRYEKFGNPLYDNDNFKDFKITNDRVLRLRLLHPDNEETILGVDLIYEIFDMRNNRVRFAHMQYKSWNNKVLYLSQAKNLMPQLEKMKGNICDATLCHGPETNERGYRFPYCSAFLRPTSKIQNSESKLITTGTHIPICKALPNLSNINKLEKRDFEDKSIKGNIFEELFTSNLAGSRWISLDDLDKFYSEKDILSHTNRIRIHAKDVFVSSEYDEIKHRGE
ncbi:hypothetical protein [Chryseobacterium aquaticum]|uniref:hypothetical protein n=1 Tax=Chryseobacterium aquaticum TaxID=452084 RepID=UPI002FCB0B56